MDVETSQFLVSLFILPLLLLLRQIVSRAALRIARMMSIDPDPGPEDQVIFDAWIREQTQIFRETVDPAVRSQAGQLDFIQDQRNAREVRAAPSALRVYSPIQVGRHSTSFRPL